MLKVVRPRDPEDGLYLDNNTARTTFNGNKNWCLADKPSRWANCQGGLTRGHYHYEHNVLALPKEYLT